MIAKACPEYSLDKPSTLVAISGAGNVAQFTALKVLELGATVLSLSDSKGSLISEKGYTKEFIKKVGALKLKGGSLESLANEEGYTYHAGTLLHFLQIPTVKIESTRIKVLAHGPSSLPSTSPSLVLPRTRFPLKRPRLCSRLVSASSRRAPTWVALPRPSISSSLPAKLAQEEFGTPPEVCVYNFFSFHV
jgi:hypothetical protein